MKYIKYVEKNTQLVNPQLDSVSLIWSEEKGKTSFYKKYEPVKVSVEDMDTQLADKETLKTQDVEIESAAIVEKLTDINNSFNSLKVAKTEINTSVILKSEEKLTLADVVINGGKDAGNGKINFYAQALELSNIEIGKQATAYNVFEGPQLPHTAYATKFVDATNITAHPSLTHNVINVYIPTDDAVISIKDSNFDLNVDTSNVLRVSNCMNASNVTIVFDNVHWTYENGKIEGADFNWAGLILYQPYGQDLAFKALSAGGTLEHVNSWKVVIKDCYYNGVKVTESNFGKHNAIGYSYNIGGARTAADIAECMTVVFE